MQILFKGESLVLTLAEYDILKLLIQRNHGVVSREDFIYTSDNIEDESSLKKKYRCDHFKNKNKISKYR